MILEKKIVQKCLCLILLMLASGQILAADLYVNTFGNNTGNCQSVASPCLTLQYAINQASANDTINMAAGVYNVLGMVTVNKTLNINGAFVNVDAKSRTGSGETVLSNTKGILVRANNVIFNGLTISGSNDPLGTLFGIKLDNTFNVDGTKILNNIFQNNISGLGLANLGITECLILDNVFQDNNIDEPNLPSGTGIYTDNIVGGQVKNVMIVRNSFINNLNAGIDFLSMNTAAPDSLITIKRNSFQPCGHGISLQNVQNSSIVSNTIINTLIPADGSISAAINLSGANSDLSITKNRLDTGAQYGVLISIVPGVFLNNNNLSIHENNFTNFGRGGMSVLKSPSGNESFATCNWWGSASGPFNLNLNPSGQGNAILGLVTLNNFYPWLLSSAQSSVCDLPDPFATSSFSPNDMVLGQSSTLIITLSNSSMFAANLVSPFSDFLPNDLEVIGTPTNTCGGIVTVQRNNGITVVTLGNGTLPAGASCQIIVRVKPMCEGTFENVIPPGALKTNQGSNPAFNRTFLNVCGEPK